MITVNCGVYQVFAQCSPHNRHEDAGRPAIRDHSHPISLGKTTIAETRYSHLVILKIMSLSAPHQPLREVLWVHLARICSPQADVASLRLTMEGHWTARLGHATLAPCAVGERLEDDKLEHSEGDGGGSDADKGRAREFERSELRFSRPKDEIEQIMAKVSTSSDSPLPSGRQLDEVLHALAPFHALDIPMFESTAATLRPTTVLSTPVPLHPTSCHPGLHCVSLEASSPVTRRVLAATVVFIL
jgi:hypothetical protein